MEITVEIVETKYLINLTSQEFSILKIAIAELSRHEKMPSKVVEKAKDMNNTLIRLS